MLKKQTNRRIQENLLLCLCGPLQRLACFYPCTQIRCFLFQVLVLLLLFMDNRVIDQNIILGFLQQMCVVVTLGVVASLALGLVPLQITISCLQCLVSGEYLSNVLEIVIVGARRDDAVKVALVPQQRSQPLFKFARVFYLLVE